jgi:hypothetical protein
MKHTEDYKNKSSERMVKDNPNKKLSDEDIRFIKTSELSSKEISKLLNINYDYVMKIRRGQWRKSVT